MGEHAPPHLVSPVALYPGYGHVHLLYTVLGELWNQHMQGQKLQKIDDGKINELLTRAGVSLLLITSSWDGHGVIMRTLLEGLTERYQKVLFFVADVEDSPRLCKVFNVTNPPGLLFIRDGELVARLQGAVGGSTITTAIEQIS